MFSGTSSLSEVFWPPCHQWLQRAKDWCREGLFTTVDWLLVGECGMPGIKQGSASRPCGWTQHCRHLGYLAHGPRGGTLLYSLAIRKQSPRPVRAPATDSADTADWVHEKGGPYSTQVDGYVAKGSRLPLKYSDVFNAVTTSYKF